MCVVRVCVYVSECVGECVKGETKISKKGSKTQQRERDKIRERGGEGRGLDSGDVQGGDAVSAARDGGRPAIEREEVELFVPPPIVGVVHFYKGAKCTCCLRVKREEDMNMKRKEGRRSGQRGFTKRRKRKCWKRDMN